MNEGMDFILSHEEMHAESGGAVVGLERSRRVGRSALPVMNLNMAALIDVVFLLMIYFMLITEFRKPEEMLDVDLPQRIESGAGADPFVLPDRPIVVTVHSFGDGESEYVLEADVPWLEEAATYEAIFRTVRAQLGTSVGADQRFVIRPTPDGRWEHALGAFNALRRAGFAEVRFASPGL